MLFIERVYNILGGLFYKFKLIKVVYYFKGLKNQKDVKIHAKSGLQ